MVCSFAIELSFLQIASFRFIFLLKGDFLVEIWEAIVGDSCSKYTLTLISHWESGKSFSFWNKSWSILISLEIHESVREIWFASESTRWFQNWINVWFEFVSEAINSITHLFLFFRVIKIYQFWWLQIVQVDIILRNRSKCCTHIWSENQTEFSEVHMSLSFSVNQF